MVLAALDIPGKLVDVGDLQIDAGLMQAGVAAVPIPEDELMGWIVGLLGHCDHLSHMCIDAVVRAAADMGYPVTVLHDACATLDLTFRGVTVPAAHAHASMMAAFEFGYGTVSFVDEYLRGL